MRQGRTSPPSYAVGPWCAPLWTYRRRASSPCRAPRTRARTDRARVRGARHGDDALRRYVQSGAHQGPTAYEGGDVRPCRIHRSVPGGRPPYGYQLVDAGPHPNPGRAASGQRAHRLEVDPLAAPVVARIFKLYAEGQGLRAIAQRLTDDGQPSPAAHDPRRNTHRDARGWAHSAVRAILKNEAY